MGCSRAGAGSGLSTCVVLTVMMLSGGDDLVKGLALYLCLVNLLWR